jgi:predicted nucleotide-binding protein (sugar kinase/HSP70/actin superfamily)
MPSSGVSDGVQSLVTEKYPQAIFCSIETTGDASANAYSRILRELFKARKLACDEYESVLHSAGNDEAYVRQRWGHRKEFRSALFYPSGKGFAGTAARVAKEVLA